MPGRLQIEAVQTQHKTRRKARNVDCNRAESLIKLNCTGGKEYERKNKTQVFKTDDQGKPEYGYAGNTGYYIIIGF